MGVHMGVLVIHRIMSGTVEASVAETVYEP